MGPGDIAEALGVIEKRFGTTPPLLSWRLFLRPLAALQRALLDGIRRRLREAFTCLDSDSSDYQQQNFQR